MNELREKILEHFEGEFEYYTREQLRQSVVFCKWVISEINHIAFEMDYELTCEEEAELFEMVFTEKGKNDEKL